MTHKRMFRIGVYGALGVAALCFFAHPYTRQLTIGPKIRGEPLCSWQQRFRHSFAPDEKANTILTKAFTWMGFQSVAPDPWPREDADMLPVILSFVDDPSPTIREAVAQRLQWFPVSPETGDALTHMLDDAAPRVRANAAQSLCRETAYQPALPRLRELMDDEDEFCRIHAACAILEADKPKDKKALGVLLRAFKSTNSHVQFMAGGSLSNFGMKFSEYLADLRAAAREDVAMRRGCALALGGFGQDAVPLLQDLLGDDDVIVRRHAAYSFRTMGPAAKAAIPSLVRALADPDENVRDMAAFALSKIDPEQYP